MQYDELMVRFVCEGARFGVGVRVIVWCEVTDGMERDLLRLTPAIARGQPVTRRGVPMMNVETVGDRERSRSPRRGDVVLLTRSRLGDPYTVTEDELLEVEDLSAM